MSLEVTEHNLVGLTDRTANEGVRNRANVVRDQASGVGMLRRRARFIATSVILCLALTVAYAILVPPTFSTKAVISIDAVNGDETASPQSEAVDVTVVRQIGLLTSPALAGRVVDQLKLDDHPEFSSQGALRHLSVLWRGEAQAALEHDQVVIRLLDRLDVSRRGTTHIVDLSFASRDPDLSALAANTLVELYLEDIEPEPADGLADDQKLLTERVAAQREAVRQANARVAAVRAENRELAASNDRSTVNPNQDQIDRLTRQLVVARAEAADAKAAFDRLAVFSAPAIDPGTLPDALTSDVISELRVQYANLSSTEAEFSLIYVDNHPRIKTVRRQLADMRRQIGREVARILASAKGEYQAAQGREQTLLAALSALTPEGQPRAEDTAELEALEREAEANQRLLEQLIDRLEAAGVEVPLQSTEASLVSRAPVPTEPEGPSLMALLAFALAAGLGLGVSGGLIADSLDKSYRTRALLEADLSLPCIGTCPFIERRDVLEAAAGAEHWGTALSVRKRRRELRSADGFANAFYRYAMMAPTSPFAETVQAVRLALASSRPVSKTLLVTSAVRHEGKSTLAANVAFGAAKGGALTLLIDCDVKNATLSDLLTPEAEYGFGDVAHSEISLEQAVTLDAATGLYFLPLSANDRSLGFDELLGNQRLKIFLDLHRDIFDLIVIDGSADLETPAGRYLLEQVERAVFVVEWGATGRQAVQTALKDLNDTDGKIIGTVFNKVDPERRRLYERDYG